MSVKDLLKAKGIGKALACSIVAALEIAKRLNRHTGVQKPRIEGPADVAEHFRSLFQGKQQEEFHGGMGSVL